MGTSSAARGPKNGHNRQFVLRTGTLSLIRRPKRGALSEIWPPIRGLASAIRRPERRRNRQFDIQSRDTGCSWSSGKGATAETFRPKGRLRGEFVVNIQSQVFILICQFQMLHIRLFDQSQILHPILCPHDRFSNLDWMELAVQSQLCNLSCSCSVVQLPLLQIFQCKIEQFQLPASTNQHQLSIRSCRTRTAQSDTSCQPQS